MSTIEQSDKSTTKLLAEIGVHHEPIPGSAGYRMLYAGAAKIGPMHVGQAYAFLLRAEAAA